MNDKDATRKKPLRRTTIAIIGAALVIVLGMGMLQENDTSCLKGYDGIMDGGSSYEIYYTPTLFGLFDNVCVIKTTYADTTLPSTTCSYWNKLIPHATIEPDLKEIYAEEDSSRRSLKVGQLGFHLTMYGPPYYSYEMKPEPTRSWRR